LTIAAPAMIVAAIAVKLSSPGPVLFVQQRAGLNGRRFRMFKFRTMVDGAEVMVRHSSRSITQGPIFKDAADYRITSVGRILRRYSLDELPQLFNVIKGEMSMVGPRPLPLCEADQIQGASRRRFSVPPGLTCIWQVNGRSDVGFERWMQYDLQYVDGWSLWSDIVLIFRTIPAVLMGRGAY
jgi:lipopolysaccharide/colanic/teichoic acid biosynthesis glycosyltransferase